MKRYTLLVVALLFLSIAAFAQDKGSDFSGVWELDLAKSKLPEMMRIESQKVTVTQTATELTVKTETKRAAPPEGAMGGPGGQRGPGGGMMRMMGGGDTPTVYVLDGKESSKEMEMPNGMPPAQLTQKSWVESDGKLKINSTRKFSTPMGDMEVKTSEIWELADSGNTLKRNTNTESPRGTQTAEMVYKKTGAVPAKDAAAEASETKPSAPKVLDTGVVNGKAVSLIKPAYPAEAKEKGIGGQVKIKVTIDEQGNVMSAQATEGESLLRKACEDAAMASKFSPTTLGGNAVKVRGYIVYNFTPGSAPPKAEDKKP